jgi:hypothetical protein
MAVAAPQRSTDDLREGLERGELPPISAWHAEVVKLAQEEAARGDAANIEKLKAQCEHLLGFTEYRYPRYRPAPVHRFVCTHLERVERREIDRLMILMPPRHGKTELASKSYPSWTIGRSPWKQFISASATADLAHDWGRDVRNIVASEAYQVIFPTRLSEDSKAAGKWNTQQGGCYYAIGVGGNPIGRGADEFLIDDPFGSMEDAKSPTIRDKVWDWYQGTVYNRLQPKGAIVLINHRMHEDDLSGRLIEQMKAGNDQWTIVELPAIALENDQMRRQKGEPLWPAQFPLEELARRRNNTLARYWSALYMQNPVPDEGELFSPDRIGVKATAEDVFMWVRAWDLAGSDEGDWTVGVLMGKTRKGSYVVGDVVRFRGRPDVVRDRIVETARADTNRIRISMPKDPGQAGLQAHGRRHLRRHPHDGSRCPSVLDRRPPLHDGR